MKINNFISSIKIVLKKKQTILILQNFKNLLNVLKLLWNKKIILGYSVLNNNLIKIFFKYDDTGNSIIKNINILASSGRPLYIKLKKLGMLNSKKIPLNVFLVLSTSGGIITNKCISKKKMGGKLLFKFST